MLRRLVLSLAVLGCAAVSVARSQAPGPISGRMTMCAMIGGRAQCWRHPSWLGRLSGLEGPAPLPHDPGLVNVTAAYSSACGLTRAGELYCIGLGNGSVMAPFTEGSLSVPCGEINCGYWPVRVAAPLTFRTFGVGGQAVCAITDQEAMYCWGTNEHGELAAVTPPRRGTPRSNRPVRAAATMRFASVAGGEQHFCALTGAGAAYCWGDNHGGELGIGRADALRHTTPLPVSGGHRFSALAVGPNASCGLTAEGAAWCWGSNFRHHLSPDSSCNLDGDVSSDCLTAPTRVQAGYTFRSLTVGDQHSCGVTTGGAAVCWGYNGSGYLGTGVRSSVDSVVATPVAPAGGLPFTQIAAGVSSTCAVTAAGEVYCWGSTHHFADFIEWRPVLHPASVVPADYDSFMLAVRESPELTAPLAAQLAAVSALRPAAPAAPPPGGKRRAPPRGLPRP